VRCRAELDTWRPVRCIVAANAAVAVAIAASVVFACLVQELEGVVAIWAFIERGMRRRNTKRQGAMSGHGIKKLQKSSLGVLHGVIPSGNSNSESTSC
jgi:hypothetical protein